MLESVLPYPHLGLSFLLYVYKGEKKEEGEYLYASYGGVLPQELSTL